MQEFGSQNDLTLGFGIGSSKIMKLGVASSTRYACVRGQYYADALLPANMLKECLEVFDEVILAHPVVHKEEAAPSEEHVSMDGARLIELPDSVGFSGMLKSLPRVFWRARRAVRQADVWHLHGPSMVIMCFWIWLWLFRIPYSLELRGDQSMDYNYLKLRGVRHPTLVAKIIRTFVWLQMSNPIAVVSVARFLTNISKPRNNCPVYFASNARIPLDLYRKERKWSNDSHVRTVVCSGRLEAQKNPIGTVKALAKLDEKGLKNWKLVWIGDGPLKQETQQLADKLGLSDKIELLGFVPWQDVFDILHTADLFLLNSVVEGLSRAMLEAMACALPVVGTTVGGWEEILPREDAVPPLRTDLLSEKLYEVLADPDRMTKMSKRNLATAKEYSADILRVKKIRFYAHVKTIVANSRKLR